MQRKMTLQKGDLYSIGNIIHKDTCLNIFVNICVI